MLDDVIIIFKNFAPVENLMNEVLFQAPMLMGFGKVDLISANVALVLQFGTDICSVLRADTNHIRWKFLSFSIYYSPFLKSFLIDHFDSIFFKNPSHMEN
jgi:hypothetical protein